MKTQIIEYKDFEGKVLPYRRLKASDLKIGTTIICTHEATDDRYHVEKIISIDSPYHFSTNIKDSWEQHIDDCRFVCL